MTESFAIIQVSTRCHVIAKQSQNDGCINLDIFSGGTLAKEDAFDHRIKDVQTSVMVPSPTCFKIITKKLNHMDATQTYLMLKYRGDGYETGAARDLWPKRFLEGE